MTKHYNYLGNIEAEQSSQSGLAVGSVRHVPEEQWSDTLREAKERTRTVIEAAKLETGVARVALASYADTVFVVPSDERRMVGSEVIGRQVDLDTGRAVDAPIYLLDKHAE